MIFIPKVMNSADTGNIDKLFTRENLQETMIPENMLTNKEKKDTHF